MQNAAEKGNRMIWIQGLLAILLAVLAIEDIKYKKINIWSIGMGYILGIAGFAIYGQSRIRSLAGGIGIGLAVCLLHWITQKGIGLGDGMLAVLIGGCIGAKFTIICLCAAFFLASFAALLLCCFRKMGRKSRIPFVPFLFLGYMITLGMEGGG